MAEPTTIPIIDIFAGPGGLAEGFSSFVNERFRFDVRLSIEKDAFAYQTLSLRKFFKSFPPGEAPREYYDYVKGKIGKEDLEKAFPEQIANSKRMVFHAELGHPDFPDKVVRKKISEALGEHDGHWGLVGGPPCQAYSVAGRSRIRPGFEEKYLNDHRHKLYLEYLKVLAWFSPAFFIMENVPGLLSTILNNESIYRTILADLEDPGKTVPVNSKKIQSAKHQYVVFSLVKERPRDLFGKFETMIPKDYIVDCDRFGIPQRRRRVIFFGIRRDLLEVAGIRQTILSPVKKIVTVRDVIDGLPSLRSSLSKEDSSEEWRNAILDQLKDLIPEAVDTEIRKRMDVAAQELQFKAKIGGRFVGGGRMAKAHKNWFFDRNIRGALNHESRSHMRSDLMRYLFMACAAETGKDAKLIDFPTSLLPKHRNVKEAIAKKHGLFGDRFHVQSYDNSATTITSHIQKDGHYFIHPDPTQCRSLTVREAARIQTFPDNYFFEGPRTAQYQQVGNAVPPLLAHLIASIVADNLERLK